MAALTEEGPVYLRLRGHIAAGILRERFKAGDQLPSVRSLAAEHGANPLTVARHATGLGYDPHPTHPHAAGGHTAPHTAITLYSLRHGSGSPEHTFAEPPKNRT